MPASRNFSHNDSLLPLPPLNKRIFRVTSMSGEKEEEEEDNGGDDDDDDDGGIGLDGEYGKGPNGKEQSNGQLWRRERRVTPASFRSHTPLPQPLPTSDTLHPPPLFPTFPPPSNNSTMSPTNRSQSLRYVHRETTSATLKTSSLHLLSTPTHLPTPTKNFSTKVFSTEYSSTTVHPPSTTTATNPTITTSSRRRGLHRNTPSRTEPHDAFFYIECTCNAWFTFELIIRSAPHHCIIVNHVFRFSISYFFFFFRIFLIFSFISVFCFHQFPTVFSLSISLHHHHHHTQVHRLPFQVLLHQDSSQPHRLRRYLLLLPRPHHD